MHVPLDNGDLCALMLLVRDLSVLLVHIVHKNIVAMHWLQYMGTCFQSLLTSQAVSETHERVYRVTARQILYQHVSANSVQNFTKGSARHSGCTSNVITSSILTITDLYNRNKKAYKASVFVKRDCCHNRLRSYCKKKQYSQTLLSQQIQIITTIDGIGLQIICHSVSQNTTQRVPWTAWTP